MKTFLFLSILLLGFFAANPIVAEDCLPVDWMYNLNIGGLKIDNEKLKSFCTEDTCSINPDFVAIRSHFDFDVALIIKDSEITTRLPYDLNAIGLIMSSMNPDLYDWKESAKIDLTFLKRNGILNIENSEIEKISEFSEKGENIFYCQSEWKDLGSNCKCFNGKETCFDCEGALPLDVLMPKDLLSYELAISEPETPAQTQEENETQPAEEKSAGEKPIYYYFVIAFFFVALISLIILKYAKNKKTFTKEGF